MNQFKKKSPLSASDEKILNSSHQRSPQSIIEDEMQKIINLGNYEAAFLFSSEGLPLAQVRNRAAVGQAEMVEISLMLKKVQRAAKSVADINDLKEIVIEGLNKRKVVFRFFTVLAQLSILAVVVTPKRSYRNLTNRLVNTVGKAMTE